ncbi:diaminopimelate epimerase [candidate division KSB1 bacterium]
MEIKFNKYSVLGNDFIIIDNREKFLHDDLKNMIRKICQRRFAVGADGVIIINNDRKDFVAEYYNSDGLPGNMCGNGARAVIDYGNRNSLCGKKTEFWVWDTKYKGEINGKLTGVELQVFSEEIMEYIYTFEGKEITGFLCNTGVPHLIIFDPELNENPSIEFAREIRYNELFKPEGTNVSFVNIIDRNSISIVTYERGVEEFTFACGTGAMAAAYTALTKDLVEFPVNVSSFGGRIEIREGHSPGSMWLWSEVSRVYSGCIESGFAN